MSTNTSFASTHAPSPAYFSRRASTCSVTRISSHLSLGHTMPLISSSCISRAWKRTSLPRTLRTGSEGRKRTSSSSVMTFIGFVRLAVLSSRSTEKIVWACQQSGMAVSSAPGGTFWRLYVTQMAAPSWIHPPTHSSNESPFIGSEAPMGSEAPTTSGNWDSTLSIRAALPLDPHSLLPTRCSLRDTSHSESTVRVSWRQLEPARSQARFRMRGAISATRSSAAGVFLVIFPSMARADSTEQTPHELGSSRSALRNCSSRASL
mmetsp:Transcript_7549/g.19350  ORF Transcript_7549/g.19350 Transcript_7549/m.19350 type:complete len:263 (-) Transcript_7549:153-941(-)